jgi:hypothetical protein
VTTDITVDDFMSGVIAACKLKGFATISMREDRFYQGIKASYDELVKKADDEDLDVRFVVHLDPLHQDSPVIGQAVTTAVQRKLVGLDNPEFVKMRIKMDERSAEELLERLPGGPALHRSLAEIFIAAETATA